MTIVSAISERCVRCYASLRDRPSRLWLVALLVAACSVVIAYCRFRLGSSIVSTHFAYLPIVLTGLWWGRRAAWIALYFIVLIICLSPLASTGETLVPDLIRAFFFVLVGLAVGTVSENVEAARRAEETSRKRLEKAQRKLIAAERLASIGQLSAGVAHEINNPLGTVLLYAHLLLKQLRADDPRRSDLEMIVSEATRCRNIVRGLLDFARQSRVSRAPTDLAPLIEDVLRIAAPRAERTGVHLTNDVPKDLPTMMIDGDQIRQMLINLVENGIDAAANGGEVYISARFRPDSESVEIQVSDDGCGIPPGNLAKLFTPFFTTKELGRGTGLGLAIAYGVVKMHSGDITVESEERQGTKFSVRLPAGRDGKRGHADSAGTDSLGTGMSSANTLPKLAVVCGPAAAGSGPSRFPEGGTS